jgi:glycosyltransferase involved in cell wall biosynthesis
VGDSSKLRVVYLDHVAELSGGELALLRLVKALPDVEAHIILATDGPLADRLHDAGFNTEILPMRERTRDLRKADVGSVALRAAAISDTLRYSVTLAKRLRRLRPDLVHANSLKSGIYGSIAAGITRTPLLWHIRDRIARDYLPLPAVFAVRTLARWAPRVLVTNSRTTGATVRGRSQMVIPSIVEPVPGDDGRRADRHDFRVAMIGRLAPWKGQDTFLRAFAKAFPDGEQRAAIIGAPLFGPSERDYALGLERLALELGIAERVEFRGHRDDIPCELARIDVLVHASLTPEPFGQTVVEGMAAGLPVVATRGGGPEEIITDGLDGILYPPGDIVELAEILKGLESDEPHRIELGAAAVRRAAAFGPAAVAAQMMRAYAEALA